MNSSINARARDGEWRWATCRVLGPLVSIFGEMLQKAPLEPRPNRNGAMRRLINRLMILLALALLALGAAAQFALIHVSLPPLAFVAGAAVLALLFAIGNLPLGARRGLVFLATLAVLAALTGGLAYFQFAVKPVMVKKFMAAAFAPKPTAVTVETVRAEKWPPELTAIGTLRAYQGVIIAP